MIEARLDPKLEFQLKGKLEFDIVRPPIGKPTSGSKYKAFPPPKTKLDVGIGINTVVKIMLGKHMEGNYMIGCIPHIEKLYVLGMVVE
jgi:hypothetical protein